MSQAAPYTRSSKEVFQPSLPLSTPIRVLVMEDDDGLRTLLNFSITHMGYEVVCVRDGAAAIVAYESALALEQPFSAVLFDLQIKGGMGGQETLAYLLDIDPQITAILCSAADQDPVMQHYDDYGFAAKLEKPFRRADLQALLHRVTCLSSQPDLGVLASLNS